MQVLQAWLRCWGAKALNLRSVHPLFIGILIIQNKMHLRTFNMSFLQRHIEIQKVFSHFLSAVQKYSTMYITYIHIHIQYLCKFRPNQWNHPFNQWCFVVVSIPLFPPLFFSLLLLRSGALYATSKVEFPQTDTIFQGAKNVKGLTEGHVDLEKMMRENQVNKFPCLGKKQKPHIFTIDDFFIPSCLGEKKTTQTSFLQMIFRKGGGKIEWSHG